MSETCTCSECNARTMRRVEGRYIADIKHDGRTFHVDLPNLDYYECPTCKSRLLADEADQRVGLELRRVAKLLMPNEIKDIRRKYGLSQKQLADLFDIGEATVCRWETGAQIQQRAFDKMLRAYDNVPAFRDYLEGKAVPLARPASISAGSSAHAWESESSAPKIH